MRELELRSNIVCFYPVVSTQPILPTTALHSAGHIRAQRGGALRFGVLARIVVDHFERI